MKTIPLTQGQFALVDDEDYDYLMQWKWFAWKPRSAYSYYATRSEHKNKRCSVIRMHRVIMQTPNSLQVDHIDGNGLNNQKSNLRNCTKSQNAMNNSNRNSKCKYKGVRHHNKHSIYARIGHNNKEYYLGTFKTEEEAARAYDIKAKELFGEFANLNFPNDQYDIK